MEEQAAVQDVTTTRTARIAGSLATVGALSACGRGGTPTPNAAPSAPSSNADPPQLSLSEASRFLAQASVGTTYGAIAQLSEGGIEGWLTAQFATSRSKSYWDWLVANNFDDPVNLHATWGWQIPLWGGLMTDSDVLRQRITLALLDLFAIGLGGLEPKWRIFSLANYLDILADNCFGNFRVLIEELTYSTAMGMWLTYKGSRKSDGRGRMPDENYARELMQLFTIGLYELDEDGTFKVDANGNAIPTYGQSDVEALAKVFTGLQFSSSEFEKIDRHRQRLIFNLDENERGPISFLGRTVSGGGEQALSQALDILFHHPNVGPFISRRLIQSLVSSNPSRGYVKRMARIFADNGNGERGDLKALIRALLLDPEARSNPPEYAGRLRDPVQRLLNWGRAFNIPADDLNLSFSLLRPLAKSPGDSPTVFNFYEPDYSPPQSILMDQGLVAPEFQLVSEDTALSYVNFMQKAIAGDYGYRGLIPDYSDYLEDAKSPPLLVSKLNIVLAAGELSEGIARQIESAVDSQPSATQNDLTRRVQMATLAIMVSPDYLVLV